MKFTWLSLVSTLLLIAFAIPARAGFIELGTSGTYRRSNFDSQSYDQSFAITGSFSYLFNEMSALEWSYTDGFSKRFVSGKGITPDQTTTVHTEFASLDFVLTLGDKDAVLRPYIKAGMGYLLKKRLIQETQGFNKLTVDDEPRGFVPTAGAGFRLAITQSLSFKLGLDAWSSDPLGHGKSNQFDVAARAGFSWLF